jgi:polyisoprenyl-teichoic acid--peptidoglycan teichoic acid transferase
MRRLRRGIAALAIGAGLLLVPDSQTAPAVFSLVEVEESTGVDFGDDDVVVVLALGSDSEGNADAIELIALNFETGQAAAVGIPRDTVVEFDGEPAKINAGLPRGGAQLMATTVADLTGVQPQYVLTTGSAGFQALVDSVGPLRVTSDFTIKDPAYDLDVTPGASTMNGLQAAGFAGTRSVLGDDFGRMSNQQHLLEAILDKLRAEEGTEGFIESGALAALEHLDTGLSPSELYRFAQAISQVDPAQTSTCVLTGPTEIDTHLGDIVNLDAAYAARVAGDAADNGYLDGGC